MEKQIIQTIRSELDKRMGRHQGETLLQLVEEPLGGEEGAADLWHDIAQEVLKLRPKPRPWWERVLRILLRRGRDVAAPPGRR